MNITFVIISEKKIKSFFFLRQESHCAGLELTESAGLLSLCNIKGSSMRLFVLFFSQCLNTGLFIIRTQSKKGAIYGHFWMLLRKRQETKTRVLRPRFLQNHKSMEKIFVACGLPTTCDLSTMCDMHTTCDFWLYTLFMWFFLTLKSINCLMLGIKLVIAWDFIHLVYGLHSSRSHHL